MRIQGVEVTEAHIGAGLYYIPDSNFSTSNQWIPCKIKKLSKSKIFLEVPDNDYEEDDLSFPSSIDSCDVYRLVWRTEQFGSDLYFQELKDRETKQAVSNFKIANEGHWDHRPENSRTKDSIKHTITNLPDLKPELTITTDRSYPHAIPTVPTPGYQTANSTFNPYNYENNTSYSGTDNRGSNLLELKLPDTTIPNRGLVFNEPQPEGFFKIDMPNQENPSAKIIKDMISNITEEQIAAVNEEIRELQKEDPVNKPSHYNFGTIEPIKVIEDWNLGFHLGNSIKYISRAKHKGNELQDLKKARYYLDRQIDLLEKNGK